MINAKFCLLAFLVIAVPGFGSADSRVFIDKSLYNISMHWVAEDNSRFTLARLAGRNVVASMMYLSCKASCPITLQRLRGIEADLKAAKKDAEIVIISFDPKTDTPAKMAAFKARHALGENWHFLNGSEADVRKIGLLFGFNYQRRGDSIEFDHSNRILLLSREGEIAATIDRLDAPNSEIVEKAAP